MSERHAEPTQFEMLLANALPSSPARRRLAAAQVADWRGFAALCQRHGVVGLVARSLSETADGVAADIVAQLRSLHRSGAMRSLALVGELHRVRRALAEAGVDSLAFKGPSLSQALLGDPLRRAPGDLDLLIRPDALTAACRVLAVLGYDRKAPVDDPETLALDLLLASRNDAEFEHRERQASVELHWRWTRNPELIAFDAGAVWGNAGAVALPGGVVPVPPALDLLTYLCVHGLRHRWYRLKWLADVAWWLATPALAPDRGAWLERARALGAERSVRATLALLARLGAASEADGSDGEAALVAGALAALQGPAGARRYGVGELVDGMALEWRMSDDWRRRLTGVAWRNVALPSERDLAMLPLPAGLRGLYPVARPALWALRRLGFGARR